MRIHPCTRFVFPFLLLAITATLGIAAGSQPVLVGSAATSSPAHTVGINGNTAYTCDTNEISVINVANPAAPVLSGIVSPPGSGTNTFCDVQRGMLVQMIDTGSPSFLTYDLTSPLSPKRTSSTPINKQFFGPPYYLGNEAFFGTNRIYFASGYPGPITDQMGDFVSMDVTNLMAPVVQGTTETQTQGPVFGGSFNVYGAIPYNGQLAYVTSTTSQGSATQTGVGQLWVVNTANPSSMSIVTKVNVPGTLQVFGPLFQNNTAVTIADTGGWREPCCGTNAFTGNVVVTVYDITNPQSPQITANVTTTYLPGPAIGTGAAVIGPHLFLYSGVIDAAGNNYFLLVDTNDPKNPVITTLQTPSSINYVRLVGNTLYAPADSGLLIYSVPGNSPPSICTGCVLNAASFSKDANGNGTPVAPGSLVAIFTSALATSAAQFTTSSLPAQLSGVSVTFNNITAPMVSVTPNGAYPFVGAQVPFGVLPSGQSSGTVPVVITVNGVPSAPVQTPIVASAPGIMTIPPTGQGNGILVFVDPADNTAKIAAPASASASIGYATAPIPRGTGGFFYATGLGAMTPAVTEGSGTCPAANGLCTANAMPTVQIGGVNVPVAFAGQAPGYPGVFQVNITVPQNVPTGGSIPLTMKSADGTVISNTAMIAVR
jgi:uncharacterized protein (TIGR03437 family)